MSDIIIFSQSLQNDEKDDLWYNGRYYQGPFLTISWSKISEPLRKMRRMKSSIRIDQVTQSRYVVSARLGYYFRVPCVENDKDGRASLVEIICSNKQKKQLEGILNSFLQESHRHFSQEVWSVIKKGLNTPFHEKRLNFDIF